VVNPDDPPRPACPRRGYARSWACQRHGGDDLSLHDWFGAQGIDPLEGRKKVEALILERRSALQEPGR